MFADVQISMFVLTIRQQNAYSQLASHPAENRNDPMLLLIPLETPSNKHLEVISPPHPYPESRHGTLADPIAATVSFCAHFDSSRPCG